ncbi:regulator of G-protein signaling loco [Caerostris darwini]|uniref:Regulator of G-protein signaling loco n=1 Tax=Caerostris darwini TaxID=1538125 RepID=A0AAV4PLJ3_9ARAC|nr:regulator of G-protein signaling loco [Caerostris darwini]
MIIIAIKENLSSITAPPKHAVLFSLAAFNAYTSLLTDPTTAAWFWEGCVHRSEHTSERSKTPKISMFGRSKQKDKSMRNQRVVGWSISFENVLEDPIGLKTFTEFLKREFSAENIMFWVACKQYSTLNDKSQMIKLAKDIYDLHLRPGATEAVNINSHSRQYVLVHLQNPPHDLFTQAEREIFTLMKFDCYQRFLKSELYSDCITAEKLGKPMPCAYLTNSKSPSRTRFRSKSRDRNRIQHAKKSNSAHYSISNELETPSTEEPSTNRRSYMSSRKEIDALWNRLQKRLDDQRGTELNFDIPDFLCNDDTTVVS